MRLKPYKHMKPSGVELLGDVPTHWGVRRLRNVADVRFSNVDKHAKDDENAVRLCNYSDVYHNNRIRSDMDFMRATATDDEVGQFRLATGDVLITKDSETWNDIGVPALIESTDADLVCGYHLALVRPTIESVGGKFLHAALSCSGVAIQLHVCANGVTRFGLSQNSIKSTWLPVPSLAEQTAIARFLDHATSRIERYIRAKEKLIALLEEQKQVIVHDAVTGRIDIRTGHPYPAYKPSGLKWLGDAPAHWDLRPGKWHFREIDERSNTGSEELLSVSHITGVTPRSEKNVTMFEAKSNIGHKLCRPGDLVINTMWAWMAALGVVRHVGIVSPSYAVYRPLASSRLSGDYGDQLLRTTNFKSEYICRSTGIRSSRLRLYPEEFLRIRLFCPPREEQKRIVAYIREASEKTQRAIASTQDEIALLQEYRTRLIADVVTGKLDVREAAAKLPELAPLTGGEGG